MNKKLFNNKIIMKQLYLRISKFTNHHDYTIRINCLCMKIFVCFGNFAYFIGYKVIHNKKN